MGQSPTFYSRVAFLLCRVIRDTAGRTTVVGSGASSIFSQFMQHHWGDIAQRPETLTKWDKFTGGTPCRKMWGFLTTKKCKS